MGARGEEVLSDAGPLKIWRYDAVSGQKALKEYEVEAPEWVTLLDVLDLIKDKVDGTLAYRKSCRMMICGSCGMRMDGAAVLVQDAHVRHRPVRPRAGDLSDGEPPGREGPRRGHGALLGQDPRGSAVARLGYADPGEKEHVVSQEQMDVIHKESLCIMCGCCVSECNSMEADPDFLGPAALAKGMRFVGDARDRTEVERLQAYSGDHGIWDCTRCYFCQERCPKGVDPRDAIAKLGAQAMEKGIDSDMGAKHARWFVTSAKTTGWLRETELVPKNQGVVSALQEIGFAMQLFKRGKVPPPVPPHVAENVGEARAVRHREDAGPGRRGRHRAGREAPRPPRIRGRAGQRALRRGFVPETAAAARRHDAETEAPTTS